LEKGLIADMEDGRGERLSKYTAEDQKLVDEAKRKQKSTTESAKAALKVILLEGSLGALMKPINSH
jgi:hypothetical protein